MATSAMPNAGNTAPGRRPWRAPASTNASTRRGVDRLGAVERDAQARQVEAVAAARAPGRRARRRSSGRRWRCRRRSDIHSIQRPGAPSEVLRARRARGRCRWSSAACSSPTRPMSWYSGSHDTSTSSSGSSAAAARDGVEVGADRAVREHHALGIGGRPAGELQDRERVGVVGRALEVAPAVGAAGPGRSGVAADHRRVARHAAR